MKTTAAERMRKFRSWQKGQRRVELWLPERVAAELDRLAKLRGSTRSLQMRSIILQALGQNGIATGFKSEGA